MNERICERAVLCLMERADATMMDVFTSRGDEELTEDNMRDWIFTVTVLSRCTASRQRFPARGTTI